MSKSNYKVLTLNTPDIDDFSKARNKLLEKSDSPWVFFLDSDELMSPALKTEIKRRIDKEKYDGYFVKRKNYFLGKPIGTDKVLRLGKKGKGKWVRRVHETWEIKGKIGSLTNPITHNSAGSLFDAVAKINKYSDLHAEANKKEGKSSNLAKIILFPKLKFGESILNGRGVVFSILQAFHSFLSWSKLWLTQKNKT
ncbi:MAG TPA: glycosyltransferase [Patescibacteria group bacterium]|nr:glycosyltransferase [Patescibacteria group bacterium]